MMTAALDGFDLIVIGGGSAGMAAAIYAAQHGKSVRVFDASGPNYDKPCGEGLMPAAIRALQQLGVMIPDSRRLEGVKYVTEDGKTALAKFKSQVGALGIRRRVLREAMWRRAQELGVSVVHAAAEKIEISNDRVRVNEVWGSYVCIATGASPRILRDAGLARSSVLPKNKIRFGMRQHIKMTPWSDNVEVYWRNHCELYVTPVSDSCVNLAILSWTPIQFQEALDLFPEIKARVGGAQWDDEPAGRAPLYHRCAKVREGRVMVAGDAAMFIDAMTGEGNTLALRSGIAAARAAVQNRPDLYRWYWLAIIWRYWIVTAPVVWASRRVWLRQRILRLLTKVPGMFQLSVDFLSAESDI